MASKNVRLSDVAAASGVSLSTASKVLNGGGRASPETRRRILETAARLNFRPNALARSFALGRSYTIGVIAEYALEVFILPVIFGASSAFGQRNMATLLLDSRNDPNVFQRHLDDLLARHVDGLLIIGTGPDKRTLWQPAGLSVPVAYAYADTGHSNVTNFLPNSVMAGRLAAEYLLEQGRTRLVHISAEQTTGAVRDRSTGFHDALAEAGMKAVHEPLYGSWLRAWGVDAVRQLLDKGVSFDGIFAGNDELATGAIRALRNAGIQVPGEVTVVGYDNLARFASVEEDVLTTIDPNLSDVGSFAALQLLAAIEGKPDPGVHWVDCRLVDRSEPRV